MLKKNVEEMLDDLAGGVNLNDKEGFASALDMDGDNQLDAGELEEMLHKTKLYTAHFCAILRTSARFCAIL